MPEPSIVALPLFILAPKPYQPDIGETVEVEIDRRWYRVSYQGACANAIYVIALCEGLSTSMMVRNVRRVEAS